MNRQKHEIIADGDILNIEHWTIGLNIVSNNDINSNVNIDQLYGNWADGIRIAFRSMSEEESKCNLCNGKYTKFKIWNLYRKSLMQCLIEWADGRLCQYVSASTKTSNKTKRNEKELERALWCHWTGACRCCWCCLVDLMVRRWDFRKIYLFFFLIIFCLLFSIHWLTHSQPESRILGDGAIVYGLTFLSQHSVCSILKCNVRFSKTEKPLVLSTLQCSFIAKSNKMWQNTHTIIVELKYYKHRV